MPAFGSTFRSDEPSLQALLEDIHEGAIQLPDFQRPWAWRDEHIRSLVASVSARRPIGKVMLLETGGEGGFQPRPVEGTHPRRAEPPERLILDGQQRLTSLYLALRSPSPAKTRTEKGDDIERWYYIDIAKALDAATARKDAVISLPADRISRSDPDRRVDLDASTTEKEIELGLFPLHVIFDPSKYDAWRQAYTRRSSESAPQKIAELDRFEAEVVTKFQEYRIPVVELTKATPKAVISQMFDWR